MDISTQSFPSQGISTKICTRCGVEKPLSQFHKQKDGGHGHRARCKACRSEEHRESYVPSPRYSPLYPGGMKKCSRCKEIKPLGDFWRDAKVPGGRASHCKECARLDYQKNHARILQRARKYHREHRDERAQYSRQYHREHRDKCLEAMRQRYENNKEAEAARHLKWCRTPAGRASIANRRTKRRAQKAGADGSHTHEEFLALCELVGERCLCCGRKEPLAEDHIIPLSKGGSDYIENIQPLCIGCNSGKGVKTTSYWLSVWS